MGRAAEDFRRTCCPGERDIASSHPACHMGEGLGFAIYLWRGKQHTLQNTATAKNRASVSTPTLQQVDGPHSLLSLL